MTESTERKGIALMAYDPAAGAAVACVGVVAFERDGEAWRFHSSVLRHLGPGGDGGWGERLAAAETRGGLSIELIDHWRESANGLVWDVRGLEPDELEGDTLEQAADSFLDDVVSNPDEDPEISSSISPEDSLKVAEDLLNAPDPDAGAAD